ncbi:MAG: YqeG family HAD IIIA-type phosphatase [Clostridia bacterium]|nr:YqeG family HAD IIIA-type phosphatase [Clostridia bacterium]
MDIYPDLYLDSVKYINSELLKKNNIKGLIIDVDNTLIDYDRNLIPGAVEWCENLKSEGINCMILSNTNKKDKVEGVAEILDLPYIMFAQKPFKRGFKKAVEQLGLKAEEIAVVGDQIFTDVIGANRMNMFSILVKQVGEKDILITKVKRPLENYIVKKYLEKKGKK